MPRESFETLKQLDAELTQLYKSADAAQHLSEWFFDYPWPAWLKGIDGRMMAINPAYTKHYGASMNDYVGNHDHDIWADDEAERFGRHDHEVAETGKAQLFSERILNPTTNETEDLFVCKFPVYGAGNLIAIGGFVIYLTI